MNLREDILKNSGTILILPTDFKEDIKRLQRYCQTKKLKNVSSIIKKNRGCRMLWKLDDDDDEEEDDDIWADDGWDEEEEDEEEEESEF